MDHSLTPQSLPQDRLDAYRVSLELVRMVGRIKVSRPVGDAMDQLRSSSSSVALNIGEGAGKAGRERARYYGIARGPACESGSAFDVLFESGAITHAEHAQGRTLCVRLYHMLSGLIRRLA